ncbi:MAG: hypothetical protein R2827_05030 [Bdellovibrionales bacterium]
MYINFSIEDLTELVRKGTLESAAIELAEFFDRRLVEDPNEETTKYDDFSFIICPDSTQRKHCSFSVHRFA